MTADQLLPCGFLLALLHVARERLFAKLEADLKRPPVEADEAMTADQLLEKGPEDIEEVMS
jgi:hypothetical protein